MRYAIVKYIRHSLVTFLPQIGIELPGKWCRNNVHQVPFPLNSPIKQSIDL